MRKQRLIWSIVVIAFVATGYGAFSLIYNYKHDKGLSIPGLVLLILGLSAFVLFSVLYIAEFSRQRRIKNEPVPQAEEPKAEENTSKTDSKPIQKPSKSEKVEYAPRTKSTYGSPSRYVSTVYVKQVGYGPILRVDGNRILDMRTNTYYRIENGIVKQEGYGPLFEIRGNQIKNAFGGYLYELSGSNINKVYGGFYASISGNYITLYDLSIKYETTDSLTKNQILAVAALLFGKY